MANQNNLVPWQPGHSGNPAGKPSGTKHLSTWIKEAMEDESFTTELSNGFTYKGAPIKVIILTLIKKVVAGDMRAFDLLAKYGYGTRVDITTKDMPVIPILAGASKLHNRGIRTG